MGTFPAWSLVAPRSSLDALCTAGRHRHFSGLVQPCQRLPVHVRYAIFVSALEECSRDNLDFVKERAMRAIAALLRAKPEGEAALLTALVNKLGDPSRKLASKV